GEKKDPAIAPLGDLPLQRQLEVLVFAARDQIGSRRIRLIGARRFQMQHAVFGDPASGYARSTIAPPLRERAPSEQRLPTRRLGGARRSLGRRRGAWGAGEQGGAEAGGERC